MPKNKPHSSSILLETRKSGSGGQSLNIMSCPKIDINNMADEREAKTILVVGETGAGKTTLLNAMLNYCEEVNFTDDFRYELVNERKLKEEGYGDANSLT